ncbi:hypothetical protein KIPB_008787 [Kipferlia bialata]|uniref:Uncharacterized protein n=1 Tax=Kipferlia bialata TaxID=797122 RepID=A0A9K3D3D1_9EUKA|nr:hypothetical protein KIPB_008787 [Kipferlia bialata]|eukprot:g8787.t1
MDPEWTRKRIAFLSGDWVSEEGSDSDSEYQPYPTEGVSRDSESVRHGDRAFVERRQVALLHKAVKRGANPLTDYQMEEVRRVKAMVDAGYDVGGDEVWNILVDAGIVSTVYGLSPEDEEDSISE